MGALSLALALSLVAILSRLIGVASFFVRFWPLPGWLAGGTKRTLSFL